MTDYQKYINALRKCAKEHENDETFTGHIIVSDLCRDTANLLEKVNQEPILDKIRAEIESAYEDLDGYDPDALPTFVCRVEDIIDKYRESEDKQ